MDLVFAPLRIQLSAHPGIFVNQVPWPDELTRSLECLSQASPGQLQPYISILDARALCLAAESEWLSYAPAVWCPEETPWTLLGVLPFIGSGRLEASGEAARTYWQSSASAWLKEWLSLQQLRGDVRVGWPVPAVNALIQLLKHEVLEVMRSFETEAPVLGWEPGALLLQWGPRTYPVTTFGLPKNKALYAAQQCVARAYPALRQEG